jgi:hypothetical protein
MNDEEALAELREAYGALEPSEGFERRVAASIRERGLFDLIYLSGRRALLAAASAAALVAAIALAGPSFEDALEAAAPAMEGP